MDAAVALLLHTPEDELGADEPRILINLFDGVANGAKRSHRLCSRKPLFCRAMNEVFAREETTAVGYEKESLLLTFTHIPLGTTK